MTDREFDPFIAGIARELKEPVRLDARLDERIMAALEPEVVSLASRRASTPWYRRTFSVQAPLGALAAAAAFAGIVALGAVARQLTRPDTPVAVIPSREVVPAANAPVDPALQLQAVQFILADPSARSVSLIGDFNDWASGATPMVFDSAHGAWTVTIPLLPGRHQYQFLVDGTRHVTDPTAPMASGDFGSPNSVITVRARQ